MDKLVLKADKRQVIGKKNKILRDKGQMPAVIYGHDFKAESIVLDEKEFEKIFTNAGHNNLVDLKIGDKTPISVLIHQVQLDSINSKPLHADFYKIKMDEEIKTTVPLHFIGESTAVFQDGGSLMTNLEEVEIEALPANLPSTIEVDISVLDSFDKAIHVADLKIPNNVQLLTDHEELVARVEPPRSDEEIAALDEEIVEEIPTEEVATEAAEAEETAESKTSETAAE